MNAVALINATVVQAIPGIAMLKPTLSLAVAVIGMTVGLTSSAGARSCADLRALCWTMRDDKSDCTRPYQRCLKTGVFITPLGRRFVATSR